MIRDDSSHASSYGGSQLPSGAWLAKSISRRTLPGCETGDVGVGAMDDVTATGAFDDVMTTALLLELPKGDGISTSGRGLVKNVYADAVLTPITRRARKSFQEEDLFIGEESIEEKTNAASLSF